MADALDDVRRRLVGVAGVSAVINLLMLSGSIYMLQVYDRVLPSRSVATLIGLSVLVLGAYLLQGCLEALRSRMLARIVALLDASLQEPLYGAVLNLSLKGASHAIALQPIRDLEMIRSFFSGMGPTAFLDMPWLPVFLIVLFFFHPLMGCVAVIGALLIISTALLAERQAKRFAEPIARRGMERAALAEEVVRNADVIRALGMQARFRSTWRRLNGAYITQSIAGRDSEANIGATAKMLRFALQSMLLAVGAALVIGDRASGGIIIASSIMMGRALAPIEIVLGTWKQMISARAALERLGNAIDEQGAAAMPAIALPRPANSLLVQQITIVPPGSDRVVVRDVSFNLLAGHGLAVVGGSGSGKSSLARALVGTWQPLRGHVRLDGIQLDRWESDRLGRQVGYLPQEVSLFAGSIADNICRFDRGAGDEAILDAAKSAAAHELITSLPEGYNTQIGDRGALLSAGQRQRIGLARALYGNPFLVVLDEPNANLDAEGEAALAGAIRQLRSRKAIVVIVSHRPGVLSELDMVLVLHNGAQVAFGPQDKVWAALTKRAPVPPTAAPPNAEVPLSATPEATPA
ncbi:MAG: type I secretion system permease/ATPase [Proteobacteria bacterium]|nr:type I secretion system permease/ATPase [Pseudomonadota bacterium]